VDPDEYTLDELRALAALMESIAEAHRTANVVYLAGGCVS
jgi:hypothetical protein